LANATTRGAAVRRGVRLEVVTVVWMVAEAVLAIGAGIAARSVLLTAFGFDSVIELLSGIVLLRRLNFEANGRSQDGIERMERTTARISAALLILLCVYVVVTSVGGLLLGLKPEGSVLGIAVAAAALVVMPLLAWAKSRANRLIGSASLRLSTSSTVPTDDTRPSSSSTTWVASRATSATAWLTYTMGIRLSSRRRSM